MYGQKSITRLKKVYFATKTIKYDEKDASLEEFDSREEK